MLYHLFAAARRRHGYVVIRNRLKKPAFLLGFGWRRYHSAHMWSRRSLLANAGAVAAATAHAQSASRMADVVVIGAGAFGVWTALHIVESKAARVTLVDAYGPGNPRATSGDETRQIRGGYGARENYTRWALRAMELWKSRQQEFGKQLFYPVGRLQMSPVWTPDMSATEAVFRKFGVASERLSPEEIQKRWPQIRPEGVGAGLYEPHAGILRARETCMTVASQFEKKGGKVILGRAEPGGESSASVLADVKLQDGSRLPASAFVFACGPWLRKLFPAILGARIATPRRDVLYFGTRAGDARFTYPNLPNFSEPGFYGFPSLDSRGFKVCPTGVDANFDPDTDERIASPYQMKRARDFLAMRFPALRDQPVVASHVCQLENTADEHFIIDRHPKWSNVWIAGGGSGHGFKHGPVLGDYIARRVLGGHPEPELEAHFRLRKA
jgi:sarcosine oxidase